MSVQRCQCTRVRFAAFFGLPLRGTKPSVDAYHHRAKKVHDADRRSKKEKTRRRIRPKENSIDRMRKGSRTGEA